MQQVAAVVGTLCMATFVMGLLYEVGSFDKTAKTIKYVIAIYITVTVIKGFDIDEIKTEIPEILQNTSEYTYNENFEKEVLRNTELGVETTIKNRLDEKNISYNQVSVHILEQNGNLTAGEITVKCEDIYRDAVLECISDISDENTKINIGV